MDWVNGLPVSNFWFYGFDDDINDMAILGEFLNRNFCATMTVNTKISVITIDLS